MHALKRFGYIDPYLRNFKELKFGFFRLRQRHPFWQNQGVAAGLDDTKLARVEKRSNLFIRSIQKKDARTSSNNTFRTEESYKSFFCYCCFTLGIISCLKILSVACLR